MLMLGQRLCHSTWWSIPVCYLYIICCDAHLHSTNIWALNIIYTQTKFPRHVNLSSVFLLILCLWGQYWKFGAGKVSPAWMSKMIDKNKKQLEIWYWKLINQKRMTFVEAVAFLFVCFFFPKIPNANLAECQCLCM